MSTSPHITTVERQAKLKRLATEKFRVVDGKVEKYKAVPPRDIEAVVAAAVAAEKRSREAIITAAKPGDRIDDDGIFLCTWEPKDRKGNSLCLKFNVIAAPEDLPQRDTYRNTVKHVSRLKGWHGHDGASYANGDALYRALKKRNYNGEWIIPPLDLLCGKEVNGGRVQDVSMFDCRNEGAFKNTFKIAAAADPDSSIYYWSSTDNLNTIVVWSADFEGDPIWHVKDGGKSFCRPVRLELKS